MSINEQAGRRARRWIVPLAVAVCVLGSTAQAADLVTQPISNDSDKPFRAVSLGAPVATAQPGMQLDIRARTGARLLRNELPSRGFLKRHLAPRLAGQMRQFVAVHALPTDAGQFGREPLEDWYGMAATYAERGTRKAVRDYLLVETSLGGFVDSVRVGSHGFGRPANEQAVDYGVDFYRGIPQLEMRHRSGAGTLRIGVGYGSATLEFRPRHAPSARVAASYDASRSLTSVSFRHAF